MNGLIALSLSLLLGQTPTSQDVSPAEGIDTGESLIQPSLTLEEAQRAVQQRELEEMQAQMRLMQAQFEAQQTDAQERLEVLEQERSYQQAAAQQLEQLRQQSLQDMERGYQGIVAATVLLEAGDFAVGPALVTAQDALAGALDSASASGTGEAAGLLQSALSYLSTVGTSVDNRDLFKARMSLQDASYWLGQAWQMTQNRSGATLVTP